MMTDPASPLTALIAQWRDRCKSWRTIPREFRLDGHADMVEAVAHCADELELLIATLPSKATELTAKWRQDAANADADGDFCCALTRRHDADELEALVARMAAHQFVPSSSDDVICAVCGDWPDASAHGRSENLCDDGVLMQIAEDQIDWIASKLETSRDVGRLALLSVLMGVRELAARLPEEARLPSAYELIVAIHVGSPAHGASCLECGKWPCSLVPTVHPFLADQPDTNDGLIRCRVCSEVELHKNHSAEARRRPSPNHKREPTMSDPDSPLTALIAQLETWVVDDPLSPFVGEAVISKREVLEALADRSEKEPER